VNARPLITAHELTKRFGNEVAVNNLSFQVPAGTLLGLIGPSGCGKTTTVRLLTGVYTPTSGKVNVLGQAPQHFSQDIRRRIGYMPQHFVLYPNLSVWENLNFTASLYGLGPNRGTHLNHLLEFVELKDHRRKLARSISGGMQRRLALAATLVHNPNLLFLDEPTAGLDPILRRKVWDYLGALKDQGRTIVVTTQYVGEAAYCDLIGVMVEGRLVTVETVDGLRRRAQGGELVELHAVHPLDTRVVSGLRTLPMIAGPVHLLDERTARLTVQDAGTAIPALVTWAQDNGLEVASIDKHEAPLDDIFVEVVSKEQQRV
jgi:ABC-2 type transport system ATP-binding protein